MRTLRTTGSPASGVTDEGRLHLAARMAHWSARHRKTAILGWLGLMIALFAISIAAPMKTIVVETAGARPESRPAWNASV